VFSCWSPPAAPGADLPDAADLERVFEDMAGLVGKAPFAVKTTEGHHFRRVVMQRKGGGPRARARA
jgi:AdoMet-dependent heme synthase